MYTPPEVEKKMKLLENENQKLRRAEQSWQTKVSNIKSLNYLLGLLLLFSLAFIGYLWKDEGHLFQGEPKVIVKEVEPEEVPIEKTSPWNEGIYFCVQIGAYEKADLSLYSEKYTFFRYHLRDNLYKYTLGIFSTYEQAHDFRRELIRLGLRDAFVQAIKDGEPVEINIALEESRNNGE
jgi:hypothetical protein